MLVSYIFVNCLAIVETRTQVSRSFTPFDLKRLDSYTNNLLDYHVILDLVSTLARHYFLGQYNPTMDSIKGVRLSPVQAAIICGVGLQNKSITDLETELGLPSSQILALFGKSIRKCVAYLDAVIEVDTTAEMAVASEVTVAGTRVGNMKRDVNDESEWDPTAVGLDEDLEEGGEGVMKELKERQEAVMANWDMSRYSFNVI
jgi:N-acetyltransferase 10